MKYLSKDILDEVVFRNAINLLISGYISQEVDMRDISAILKDIADDWNKEMDKMEKNIC